MPNILLPGTVNTQTRQGYILVSGTGTNFTYVAEERRGIKPGDIILIGDKTALEVIAVDSATQIKADTNEGLKFSAVNNAKIELITICEHSKSIDDLFKDLRKDADKTLERVDRGTYFSGLNDVLAKIDSGLAVEMEGTIQVTVSVSIDPEYPSALTVAGTGTKFASNSNAIGRALAPGDRLFIVSSFAPESSLIIETVTSDTSLTLKPVRSAESFVVPAKTRYRAMLSAIGIKDKAFSDIKTVFRGAVDKAIGDVNSCLEQSKQDITYNLDCGDYNALFKSVQRSSMSVLNTDLCAKVDLFKKAMQTLFNKINTVSNLINMASLYMTEISNLIDGSDLNITPGLNNISNTTQTAIDNAIAISGYDPNDVRNISNITGTNISDIVKRLSDSNSPFSSAFVNGSGELICDPVQQFDDTLNDIILAGDFTSSNQILSNMNVLEGILNNVSNENKDILDIVRNLSKFDLLDSNPIPERYQDILNNFIGVMEGVTSATESVVKAGDLKNDPDICDKITELNSLVRKSFCATIIAKRTIELQTDAASTGNHECQPSAAFLNSIKNFLNGLNLGNIDKELDLFKNNIGAFKVLSCRKAAGASYSGLGFGSNMSASLALNMSNIDSFNANIVANTQTDFNSIDIKPNKVILDALSILKSAKFDKAKKALEQGNIDSFRDMKPELSSSLSCVIDNLREVVRNSSTLGVSSSASDCLTFFLNMRARLEVSAISLYCSLDKEAREEIKRKKEQYNKYEECAKSLEKFLKIAVSNVLES